MDSPFLHSALIFLSAFVLEDVTVLGAAALVLTSMIPLPWAAASSFAGVWCGDLGLYFLARRYGRPVIEKPWFRRLAGKTIDLDKSEGWFSRHGSAALALSRVLPGSRLPTFLSAGLLRVPPGRFIWLTSITCGLWVAALFALTYKAGPQVIPLFRRLQAVSGEAILIAFAFGLLVWLLRKTQHWEFWPAALFYVPVALKYISLAVRYRSFMLPTAANPGMHTGGVIGESKFPTLSELAEAHPELVARTRIVTAGPLEQRLRAAGSIEYPVVFMPNVGQRGLGFRVVHSDAEARAYLEQFPADTLIQTYVPGPHEVGIFYYRLPGKPRGRILSIGEKVFPSVIGDGNRSLEQLIRGNARASLKPDIFLKRFADSLSDIPACGQIVRLVEAGNHCQGAVFLDGQHLWSAELEETIDRLSQSVNGFFIGRYDVRFESAEALRRGEGFQILELNGVSAEPASIYDPSNSLLSAWRTLFRLWEIIFAIGDANRECGVAGTKPSTIWKNWLRYRRQAALCPVSD